MSKCKHRNSLILGRMFIQTFQPDDEPYNAGVGIDMDEIAIERLINGFYCPKCDTIVKVFDR